MRFHHVMMLCAATGCTPAAEELSDELPTLRASGTSSLVTRLLQPLAETHSQTVTTMQFDLTPQRTSQAFRALLDGEADVIAVDRQSTPAEEEQAKANGYQLSADGARTILAVDVVAVAVHPSNPINAMTYEQVIGVFCTGELDNWEDLGRESAQIQALTLDPLSGTRGLFEDFFCGPSGIDTRIPQRDPESMGDALENTPEAIGIVSASSRSGKLIGLRYDARQPATHPSQANVIRGTYPLASDVYLYTAGPATGLALDFIDWISTPAGQEEVDEARFIPLFLRPERLDEPRPLRETVHFEVGSSEPTQRSMARMDVLVEDVRDRAGEYRHVVLEGFTDPTEARPVELSRARAEAVRDLLQAELPGVFYEIIPRGARNPIAPNETPLGRQRNRRVQVYLEEDAAPVGSGTEVE